ncbi:probable jasmonic acid carboxyl methyltransferase 2 [Actinidia eriantha]|uniref:probable jasmonic acid carboxyl methyltransferase 2 n=1 Tax=Actinidia eriantha TaxID=165200 RepID=UPI00258EF863|nr:probable jasmonic acid carboxyl methyltransferase 2 [Actinidia eriantha]
MEVMLVLHMNKGEGETSYAKNSTVQRKIISLANSITEEAVVGILCNNFPDSLGIADLGCSSGPNTLTVISEIIDIVRATSFRLDRPIPEFRVSLNDLPSNDFNEVFKSLPEFYNKLKREKGGGFNRCFISGVPGSFYGRLFPNKSLHFVHSSSSLHWLSQVPPALDSKARTHLNRGKLYISKTSPHCVLEAYLSQFEKDLFLFLKSRSEEMVPGGRMVLSFMGRRSVDPSAEESCYHWELLAQALMSMASEGLVEEEKIDSFNVPYYAPCPEELKSVVKTEGSFVVDRLETFEIDWDGGVLSNSISEARKTDLETFSSGQRVAKTIRAVVEPMLESHFGKQIMDDLFYRYSAIVDDYLSENRTKYIILVVSFTKKG